MITLKEMVRERQTSEPRSDASTEKADMPPRGIRIDAWNGEKWILPWGYFYSAHLQGTADREQLVLRIAHHEVVLEGVRLALLLPGIAGFQLECLRDLPGKFRVDADENVPFISRVAVRPAADSEQARAETS